MKQGITMLITLALAITAIGQQKTQQLLDLAILNRYHWEKFHQVVPVFVWHEPLVATRLNKHDPYRLYRDYVQEWPVRVDSAVVMEIVAKAQRFNSAPWKQQELHHAILCTSRNVFSYPALEKKLQLKTVTQRQLYQERVRLFNKEIDAERPILYFSRPVFDRTGRYALIEFSQPGQSFGSRMYQLTRQGWKELGLLTLGHF